VEFHPSAVIIEGGFRLLAVILNARTQAKKRTAIYASWIVFAILTRKTSRKAFRRLNRDRSYPHEIPWTSRQQFSDWIVI
jgi:hypothetical protein